MSKLYPYATGNLIEHPNDYFYSPYQGSDFFVSWRASRDSVRQKLSAACPPPKAEVAPASSDKSVDLLERALAGDNLLCEAFVKKFEVTKRVHERYDADFRAIDKKRRNDLSLYVRAADLFEAAYDATGSSRHLNVYLKCLDTLCAHAADMPAPLSARLAWHIDRERTHVERFAAAVGAPL